MKVEAPCSSAIGSSCRDLRLTHKGTGVSATCVPGRIVGRCRIGTANKANAWAALANARQAASLAAHLPLFEHDHGLATTEPSWADEDQHDYPTGWAYSHWYVTQGLLRYGYRDEAVRIALKWLRLVAGRLHQDGAIFERYNVVDSDGPTPGRYGPQRGFGWTNGVFAALLTRVVLGLDARGPEPTGARRVSTALPASWAGKETRIHLPRYPWPTGTRRTIVPPPPQR